MFTFITTIDIQDLELHKSLVLPFELIEVEIEVSYSVSKFYPQTAFTPEEPAELEIESCDFIGVSSETGKMLDLSELTLSYIEGVVDADIGFGLYEKLEVLCWEDYEGIELEVRR